MNLSACPRSASRRLGGIGALRFSYLLMVSILVPPFAFPQAGNPQLTLDSVNVRQDGMVTFSALPLGWENRSDFSEQGYILGQTEDGVFRLWVDIESIQQVRFNAFTFTCYVFDTRTDTKRAFKFQITGNPTGSFRDVPTRVSFHVKTLAGNYEGWIRIPVYNSARTDLLLTEKQTEPAYVSVSGSTQIQIPLRNVTESLPIRVTDVAVNEDCPQCWTRISSTVSEKTPLVLSPGTSGHLPIEVAANSLPALLHGALLIKTDMPHDTLSVILTYHTVPGGAEKKQAIPANIRFGPGLLGLALALCGGIALGLTARYLLTGKLGTANETALHAILTALVLGLVAEFVGVMLMAYGNSKLVLLGLDIDPRQLFPAFILAMLVSGGSAVTSWIKQMFPKTS
jgi:hypothetical protein